MRKIAQLLILAIVSLNLHAQPYVPFPDSNATWHVAHEYDVRTYSYTNYTLGGDTTINGIQYTQVISPDYYPVSINDSVIGGIREDSLQRIFFYGVLTVQFSNFDSIGEYLLYQFGLNIGDTIPLFKLNPASGPITVQDIDSVLVDGSYRKRYTISNGNAEHEPLGWYTQTWIEGIGSDWGLLGPYAYSFEGGWTLYCFQQNGLYIYPDSNCLSVGIDQLPNNSAQLTLTPNPASTSITIQLTNPSLHLKSATLHSITGQQLNATQLNQHSQPTTLSLENLSSGLYLCHITLTNGTTITRKVIRQ